MLCFVCFLFLFVLFCFVFFSFFVLFSFKSHTCLMDGNTSMVYAKYLCLYHTHMWGYKILSWYYRIWHYRIWWYKIFCCRYRIWWYIRWWLKILCWWYKRVWWGYTYKYDSDMQKTYVGDKQTLKLWLSTHKYVFP